MLPIAQANNGALLKKISQSLIPLELQAQHLLLQNAVLIIGYVENQRCLVWNINMKQTHGSVWYVCSMPERMAPLKLLRIHDITFFMKAFSTKSLFCSEPQKLSLSRFGLYGIFYMYVCSLLKHLDEPDMHMHYHFLYTYLSVSIHHYPGRTPQTDPIPSPHTLPPPSQRQPQSVLD